MGYVRLHGRNFRDWFRRTAGRDERYDYLYTADELRPWSKRIGDVAGLAEDTYAVTNNHRNGQAPANAAMLESLVTGQKVAIPPALFDRYAQVLEPFALKG